MENDSGELVVGIMMAVFGLIGLFLAAGAADDEMYVFGMSLCGFTVCFEFGLIRRHYARRDRARALARVASQGGHRPGRGGERLRPGRAPGHL